MKNRTILTMALLVACMASAFAAADAYDADDEIELMRTTFVIGETYEDALVAFGYSVSGDLPGMTFQAIERDGVHMVIANGTPDREKAVLLTLTDESGTAFYIDAKTVTPESIEYGGDSPKTYTFLRGETYSQIIMLGSTVVSGAVPGMQINVTNNNFIGISGTPTTTSVYTIVSDVERAIIYVTDSAGILSVTIVKDDGEDLTVNESMQLSAKVDPPSATQTVTWSSSNPGVATVSSNGLLEAKSNGTALIKAASTVDPTKFDSFTVYVSGGSTPAATVQSIEIQGDSNVQVNGTITLTANVTMTDRSTYSGTVSWTSNDTSKATVSNGIVTGKAPGSVTITASAGTITVTKPITVTDGSTPSELTIESITIEGDAHSVGKGQTIALTAKARMSDNSVVTYDGPITWTAENANVTIQNPNSNPCQVKGNVAPSEVKITVTAGNLIASTYVNVNEQTRHNYYTYIWVFTTENTGYYSRLSSGNTSGNLSLPTVDSSQIASSYTFKGWAKYSQQQDFSTVLTSGNVITNNETTISSDSYFYAVYTPKTTPDQTYTITVKVDENEGGTVRVSGNGVFRQGEQATITAVANEGYKFSTWNDVGADATKASRTITVTTNATYIASFVPTTGPLASMQTVVIKSSNSSLGIVNVNIMSPSLASQSGNNLVVPKGTSVTPVGNTLKFVYNETEIAKAWITETGGTFKTWNASSYAVNHDGIEFTALFEEKAFDWEGFFQKNVTYLVGGILAVIIAMLIITRI